MKQKSSLISFALACVFGVAGLHYSEAASLLVASGNTDQVLRYDSSSGAYLGVFAQSGGLDRPSGLAYGPDNNLYVSSLFTDSILKFNGQTGAFLGTFVAPGLGGLDEPRSITFGPDGHLYATSNTGIDGAVLKYHGSTGAFLGTFVTSSSSYLVDLGFGPDGNLYTTRRASGGPSVTRYNGSTGAFIDVFATGFSGNGPMGFTFGGPDGDLFVADYNASAVRRFDGVNGASEGSFITFGSESEVGYVLFDGVGNLLVSRGDDQVLRFNGTTAAFIDALVPPGSGLDGPMDMILSSQPVPEPSATMLWAGGGLLLYSTRRRMA